MRIVFKPTPLRALLWNWVKLVILFLEQCGNAQHVSEVTSSSFCFLTDH